jgi:hypothetical protein
MEHSTSRRVSSWDSSFPDLEKVDLTPNEETKKLLFHFDFMRSIFMSSHITDSLSDEAWLTVHL